ncbi:hypothetical protein DSO57_1029045 [Entomophthora muscae]|uniref:Uncharacterized protein n=1 Tax=Entomophthora muscae TaxID=34485 RepID=A0ACC2SEN9_9FUNG|nr:hypothetical protein DSO57_1029045 [Entomophthora muscae]
MKGTLSTPPLPNVPPAYDFTLGLVYQVLPHTRSWHPLATAVNHIFRITPIVYMAFHAQPASPVGVQLDSGMGCDAFQDPPFSCPDKVKDKSTL